MKRKFLALLLSFCMALSLLPVSALAEGGDESSDTGTTSVAKDDPKPTINKSATNLKNDQTDVTLSIGASSEQSTADVVFVLDKSTSTDVKAEALDMLAELQKVAAEGDLNVNVGVVIFNKSANNEGYVLPLTPLAEALEPLEDSSEKNAISAIFEKTLNSGTNIEAGIRKGMELLESDKTPLADKHLVLVTDGVTYMWGTGETPQTVYVELNNTKAASVDMVNDYYSCRSKEYNAYKDAAQWMSSAKNGGIEEIIEKYQTDYTIAYGADVGKYIPTSENSQYSSLEAAIYMAGKAWQDAADAGYVLHAYASDSYISSEKYPWGPNFISGLSTISGTSTLYNDTANQVDGMFDSVKNSILYEIQKGTVTDVVGDAFELNEGTFKLSVGNTEIVQDGTTTTGYDVSFDNGNYGVTYNKETKTITWDINVPVEAGKALALSYGLTLTEKETEPGIHKVPTNESATLNYTSTTETEGTEVFPVPTLTYSTWETSKSKTATNLDSNYESKVTLSLPSAEEQLVSDVVFVLDKSESTVKAEISEEIEALCSAIQKTEGKVNVGVVTFNSTVANSLSLTELTAENLVTIKSAINYANSNGTNIHAGLQKGIELLKTGTADENHKYLILVSDGITYLYNNEKGEGPKAINYNGETTSSHYAYEYGNNNAPENWEAFLENAAERVEKDETTYEGSWSIDSNGKTSVTGSTKSLVGSTAYVKEGITDLRTGHAMSATKALLRTYEAYQEAMELCGQNHVYAIGRENSSFPWGNSFMTYLSDISAGEQDVKTIIWDDIYYLLDAGSYVVDMIGNDKDSNGNEYNFDFVNAANALTLTVSGVKYTTSANNNQLSDNETARYIFTSDGVNATNGKEAPFVLHYYEKGQDGQSAECFVWEINVPVSRFAPVQLTYTVKLTNPQTTAGTYGQYDADGSDGGTALYTNNSATLYPVDSNGDKGVPENFLKPTVSYEVKKPSKPTNPANPTTPVTPPPALNTEDHFAYIIGYPVDYYTGEPTDDQTKKPVKPEGNITRAEVATIFFRLLTDEVRNEYWSQTCEYSDVDIDDWFNNAVCTLSNFGILKGYEDGTFRPNGNITRAEFATIAVRFFEVEYNGKDLFPDIDGHWAQDYINQAGFAGLVEGYPDGTFGPEKLITRAEAVTIVNRTIDRHPDKEHLLDDMLVWPDNMDTTKWYYADMQEATNSHEYTMHTKTAETESQTKYEIWQKILPVRDWEAFEKAWADANAAANPGEVVR